jgi:hypothetical protein
MRLLLMFGGVEYLGIPNEIVILSGGEGSTVRRRMNPLRAKSIIPRLRYDAARLRFARDDNLLRMASLHA